MASTGATEKAKGYRRTEMKAVKASGWIKTTENYFRILIVGVLMVIVAAVVLTGSMYALKHHRIDGSQKERLGGIYGIVAIAGLAMLAVGALGYSNRRDKAKLIRRWSRGVPAVNAFPMDAIECAGYFDWGLKDLTSHAELFTAKIWFRQAAQDALDGLKLNAPKKTSIQISPDDIDKFRQKNMEVEDEFGRQFSEAKTKVTNAKSDAEAASREYNLWYDLLRDLGEHYNLNMLPPDGKGGTLTPNAFRFGLQVAAFKTPPDPSQAATAKSEPPLEPPAYSIEHWVKPLTE